MKTYSMVVLITPLAGVGFSQESDANETDHWQYEFTPYLMVTGLEGTTGLRGYKTDLDASFSDIIENLDIGFMGMFTVNKGLWTFVLEGMYIDLSNETTSPIKGPGGFLTGNGELSRRWTFLLLIKYHSDAKLKP